MSRTRVVPLGGLGEIGLNALALESGDDVVLVDCGLLFPGAGHPGIDCLVPDFTWLRERRERLRGVLLTHGHEDHVGALGYLLREMPVPVHGTALTLSLLEPRLRAVEPRGRRWLRPVATGDVVGLGSFRAEFIRVTHSVPEACALGIESPGGTVLHSGDFKFDPTPVDGRRTDEEALARWGGRGVDLLCCDSTNAGRAGATPSEQVVGTFLRRTIPTVTGRVYLATFASHVHRVQLVLEASRASKRRTAFLGRSLEQSLRAARRLGHLRPAPGDVVPVSHLGRLPRGQTTVVLGGSQAEVGSALWRVARGLEPEHGIEPGDGVFLCARTIPGNETAVHAMVDRCLRRGARVWWDEAPGAHVSGHPSAEDVVRMLGIARPRSVLPVHGEVRHLEAAAEIARRHGVPAGSVFRLENGHTLEMEGGRVRTGPPVVAGRVCVEGNEPLAGGRALLAERVHLGRQGVAVAVLRLDPEGRVRVERVRLHGVVPPESAEVSAHEAAGALARGLGAGAGGARIGDPEREARRILRRHFRSLGRHPLVAVVALSDGGTSPAPASGPASPGEATPGDG